MSQSPIEKCSNISGNYFNASGKLSINHLVELLGGDKVFIQRPGEPDSFADISLIKKNLVSKDIDEGVEEILKNIDYWSEAPIWSPEKIAIATKEWFKYLKN